MFDNIFSTSPAHWAGLAGAAIAIPILIHLINLVRHKTVRWAAMEFLLKSHKKNRNYIWLKQLLLLLSRIAALLLALFLLGQVGCHEDRISRLLGGRTTHHYVILDDSFSMGDRGPIETSPTAFDRAVTTISLIAARSKDRQNQKFTLLRNSKTPPSKQPPGTADIQSEILNIADTPDGTVPSKTARPPGSAGPKGLASNSIVAGDLENVSVDSRFDNRLEDAKARLTVSSQTAGIDAALDRVTGLVKERTDENAIVYVLSDFREKDWQAVSDYQEQFSAIRNAGGAIELIDCAPETKGNVSIVDLRPMGNIRVANTPLMMSVSIKNDSATAVNKLQVAIQTTEFSQPNIPAGLVSKETDLPLIFIEEIAAGATETRTFPVFFNSPGKHSVTASLPDDALNADNDRHCVIEFKSASQVLLIDDANQRDSRYVKLAISANGKTGLVPVREPKSFLRDADGEQLGNFDAIFLLDVDAIDEPAVENLKQYCRSGGGVGFFLGPKSNLSFYNSLYTPSGKDQPASLFPFQIDSVRSIPEVSSVAPDFVPIDHPIFLPTTGQQNSLLDRVQIEKVIAPTRQWLLEPASRSKVIATIRGDKNLPLILESNFGLGRVIVCTTTAGTRWNNWAKNPTYPPILLLIQDYLAAGKKITNDRIVQSQLTVDKRGENYLPNMTVLSPILNSKEREQTEFQLETSGGKLTTTLSSYRTGDGGASDASVTVQPGIYDFWYQRSDGEFEVERFALNVDIAESQLEKIKKSKIATDLQAAQPVFSRWDQFNPTPEIRSASSLSRLFLGVLVITLIAEQLLAYSSSYHRGAPATPHSH